jgi:acyl carrier protein
MTRPVESPQERVRRLIAEHLRLEVEQLPDHAALQRDLALDSLDAIELIVSLQDTLQVEIDSSDVERLFESATVGTVIAVIAAARPVGVSAIAGRGSWG